MLVALDFAEMDESINADGSAELLLVTVDEPAVPPPTVKQHEQQQVQQHIPGRFFSVSINGAERSSTTFMVNSNVFMVFLFNNNCLLVDGFSAIAKINLLQRK